MTSSAAFACDFTLLGDPSMPTLPTNFLYLRTISRPRNLQSPSSFTNPFDCKLAVHFFRPIYNRQKTSWTNLGFGSYRCCVETLASAIVFQRPPRFERLPLCLLRPVSMIRFKKIASWEEIRRDGSNVTVQRSLRLSAVSSQHSPL
jgi:hypothetical protein